MNTKKTNHILPIILLIIGCIIFGMGSLIVATSPLGAYSIAFWRLAIAGCVFAIFFMIYRHSFPKLKTTWLYAALAGFFLAWDLAFWHESVYAVGPGISTLLNSLQVFFLAAIGYFIFHEALKINRIFSLLFAISGVALIAGVEFNQNEHANWGFFSGILSGGFFALSMIFIRQAHKKENISLISLMLILNVAGALSLLPFIFWDARPFLPTNLWDWLMVGTYGLLMQCLAWALIAHSIPKLSLSLTGLILLSEPVAALVIDALVLNKSITHNQWLGCLITLLAIYWGSLVHEKKETEVIK